VILKALRSGIILVGPVSDPKTKIYSYFEGDSGLILTQ
jgi:hypothetical protein